MTAAPPAKSQNAPVRPRPAVLCVLDGWGWREGGADNAIHLARTPNYDRMLKECPHALLATSGRAVGLPEGQMGNSEVGHTNIGAGRMVMQDLPRIDDAVAAGTLAARPALRALIAAAANANRVVHLMGLVSPGGVHSHQAHIAALARILAQDRLAVRIHAFLDGRDTPPRSAAGFVESLEKEIAALPSVRLATVSGRYYAMDRDSRWERIAKAYDAIVAAKGARFSGSKSAIEASYANNTGDEFVAPCIIGDYSGAADGDGLLFANFRPDRARELSAALLDPAFAGFARAKTVRFAAAAGMTEYSAPLKAYMGALFPPQNITATIGELFSGKGLAQLRIAETEKYAHVTFFMNGGRETQYPGEDRILVPSPKVATYDLTPEMAASEMTDRLVEAVQSGKYDLIVCNYANPDMVGHTGMLKAAIAAVETVDACLGRLRQAVENSGGVLLITADHGNVERMASPENGEPHTAHTLGDVPILAVNSGRAIALRNGRLADVAPTLLDLIGMAKPAEMTGQSLIVPVAGAVRKIAAAGSLT